MKEKFEELRRERERRLGRQKIVLEKKVGNDVCHYARKTPEQGLRDLNANLKEHRQKRQPSIDEDESEYYWANFLLRTSAPSCPRLRLSEEPTLARYLNEIDEGSILAENVDFLDTVLEYKLNSNESVLVVLCEAHPKDNANLPSGYALVEISVDQSRWPYQYRHLFLGHVDTEETAQKLFRHYAGLEPLPADDKDLWLFECL